MTKVIESVVVNTASIKPGDSVQLTVTMNEVGAVTLTTDCDNALCTCPATVSVLGGASTVAFNVTVGSSAAPGQKVKVRVRCHTQIYTATFTVGYNVLGPLTASPNIVLGGSTGPVLVTVRLQNDAPLGGCEIEFSQNSGPAFGFSDVPPRVFIPEGDDAVQFYLNHTKVTRNVGVTLYARYAGSESTAFVTILPAP